MKENEYITLRACEDMKRNITAKTPYLEQNLELSWEDGMIGVLPVFDNHEKALEYVNNKPENLREVFVPKNKYEEYRNI